MRQQREAVTDDENNQNPAVAEGEVVQPDKSLARIRLQTRVRVRARCGACGWQDLVEADSIPDGGMELSCKGCGATLVVTKPRPVEVPSSEARDRDGGLSRATSRPGRRLSSTSAPVRAAGSLTLDDRPVSAQNVSGGDLSREPRGEVNLAIRYLGADNYAFQYAKNLSRGGVFVAGAEQLEVGQIASIQIDLVGMGTFTIRGEVRHVVDHERAAALGREPGAGFQIVDSPESFPDAVSSYLLRLWRRRNVDVLSNVSRLTRVLTASGFEIHPIISLDEVAATIAGARRPVVGLLVHERDAEVFVEELGAAKAADLLIVVPDEGGIDEILEDLDQRVASVRPRLP